MTQIIGILTRTYVVMASDRMVTHLNEEGEISIRDDATCKLVNFCNTAAIAYSGIAEVGGRPTNEWIAKTIAKANCRMVQEVANILMDQATKELKDDHKKYRALEIIIGGWGNFPEHGGLIPCLIKISNCFDNEGRLLPESKDQFDIRSCRIDKGKPFVFAVGGSELDPIRHQRFAADILELVSSEAQPVDVLKTTIQEIIRTSITQVTKTVGSKILSVVLPKAAIETSETSGKFSFVAAPPTLSTATFYYFEDGYNELSQIGPSFVCGGTAFSKIVGETSPDGKVQSSTVTILHLPNMQEE